MLKIYQMLFEITTCIFSSFLWHMGFDLSGQRFQAVQTNVDGLHRQHCDGNSAELGNSKWLLGLFVVRLLYDSVMLFSTESKTKRLDGA